MPDETAQQKAERQARLSHAMGVMFLQDKVDKLERDVTKIAYPRGMHKSKSGPPADLAFSNSPHEAVQGRPMPRAVTGPGVKSSAESTNNQPTSTNSTASSVRLVDASVLIFSLRSVHNWSRDQSTCVIIPLEAINTLDLLKKGDEPINLAARKATRWLEEKIAVSTQSGDDMLVHPLPGIFAQRESFRASPAQIEATREEARNQTLEASSTEHESVQDTVAAAAASTSNDMFSATDAPRYLRELLSACLYCHQHASSDSNYAVAIAYPPAHVQEKMIEAQSALHDKPSYLNRTDGRATEAWLDAYRIPFEVVPTSKTWTGEKPSSRFRNEIGRGPNVGSSEDLLGLHSARRTGSPTPSVSSSTGSFKSELSGLSMLSSQKSPRHRQDSRFAHTTAPLRSVRCMSTSAAASSSSCSAAPASISAFDSCSVASGGNEDADNHQESADYEDDGPIIARPSSAASSHTSFVSSLTTSTQDDWSSQTSTSASFSSHCGTRIVRHAPSSTMSTSAMDSTASSLNPMSTVSGSDSYVASGGGSVGGGVPRLTSRTLHKTKSGADKMEEYLRRLDAGSSSSSSGGGSGANVGRNGGGDRRTATSTPTPQERWHC